MAQAPPILIYSPGGGVSSPIGSNPPVYSQADTTALIEGQAYIDIVFSAVQTDEDWVLVACEIENTTDLEPLNIWPGIITDKSTAGFRIQLNGMPDSGNYYLRWAVSGINIEPVAATSYQLLGPTTGTYGVEATFTVKLFPSTTLTYPLTVTPDDGGDGGVFSPTSVTLTAGSPIKTFTYAAASFGVKTIGVTNDLVFTDPASLTFTVPPVEYALTGPSTGEVGVASTNFTVAVGLEQALPGTITITPSDGGDGGTFTPTTVELETGIPIATFTYTPASIGDKTISVTNDGGLTNPANLTYTSTTPAPEVYDTFTDADLTPLPSHTMDIGTGWTRFTGAGANHIRIQGNNAASYPDAGNAYFYITESLQSNGTISVEIAFGAADNAHYCHLFFRYTDASNYWLLRTNGGGGNNIELAKVVAGVETVISTGALSVVAATAYLLSATISGSSISVAAGVASGGPTLNTTDAFNSTATKHGIGMYQGSGPVNLMDNFQVI